MKKTIQFFLVMLSFAFLLKNEAKAQTVVVNINYGPYTCQCCTGNGVPYSCFNDPGVACNLNCPTTTSGACSCGTSAACNTQTFINPVPAGNIVTQVNASYDAINCGGSVSSTLNGTNIGSTAIINGSCLCSGISYGSTGTTGTNFFCGMPSYNNAAGATETFQACFTGQVCITRITLTLTYAPASQAVPAAQPGAITGPASVCVGAGNTYSIPAVGNATGYTWSVPAGWTINSGQGTTSINATPGAAGNICVTASNLCGASPPTCLAVSLATPSSAPAGASASPNPICPSNPTTLSVSGGSLGVGASWDWYTGGCGGTFVGTGASIVVSPAGTTTYYVAAVGTCNTTACASVVVNMGGTTATPGAPTGNTNVCNGSSNAYSTTGSVGATSYNWTVPGGAVINSGQGTTSISVTMGASSGNICVDATGPCGTSAQACTFVTITTVPLAPTSITGTTPVCPGNENYSIGGVAGATGYTWSTAGAGGSITGGQGTTGLSVNWSSSGTGVVSVTANNACGSSSAATFTVLVNPLPNVTIVPSSTAICSGATATLTASGAVNYTWIGGTIPTTGAVVTVSPTTTSPYVVTGTDANNCVNTANITITVNPTPTVSISGGGANSQTVCSGGAISPITFVVTPAGTVNWTNSNTALGGPDLSNPSGIGNIGGYTAPNVVSQTTGVVTANATSNNGCSSTASTNLTYTITINALPVVTASVTTPAPCGQTTGCINSVTASGSGPFQFSFDGGITWSVSSSTCGIGSGTYTVEIKDNNGCIANPTVFVPSTSGPAAPTVASTSATVCEFGTVTLSITAPVGTYTYTWTDVTGTHTGTSYIITNITPSGNYVVTVYATDPSNCVGSTTTTTITVNPAPSAPILGGSAINPLIECQGVTPQAVTVVTTGTVTSVPVWYNGATWIATGTSYTPSTATAGTTVYTILDSATVTGCKDASAGNVLTVTVTINPGPTAPILGGSGTNPLVECQGSAAQTVIVAATGTITSVPVWYNGATWVASGTSYTPSTATAGTTVYTISDSATVTGCSSAATGNVLTVTVTINPLPTGPILGGLATNPLTECQGSTAQSVVVATTGTVTSVPVWYNGATYVTTGLTFTPSTATAGTTVYTIADSATVGGCVNLSAGNVLSVTVTILASPTGPILTGLATNPLIECQNSIAQAVTVAPTGTISSVPVWYNGATWVASGLSYTPSTATPGTTIYTVIDSATVGGCKNISAGNVLSVTVTINPAPTAPVISGSATNPFIECQGASQAITVATTGTVTSVPVWYNGATWVATGNSYTPSTTFTGTTVYTVVDSATVTGCKDLSAGNVLTVTVTVNPSPTANSTAVVDSAHCGLPTGGVHGVVASGGTPGYHYQWYNGSTPIAGDTLATLTNVANGTYSVLITDANGCPTSGGITTFTVASGIPVVASFIPSTQLGNAPLSVTFTNTSTGATSYTWTLGNNTTTSTQQNTSYTYSMPGTYTVVLIASNGTCADTTTATVIVDVPTTIIIPNVFSPNGDSLNDEFYIACTGMQSLNCDIFNRWGQKVFTLTGPNQSWDGRLNNGNAATEGTYYYMLVAIGYDKKTYTYQGPLTLVK